MGALCSAYTVLLTSQGIRMIKIQAITLILHTNVNIPKFPKLPKFQSLFSSDKKRLNLFTSKANYPNKRPMIFTNLEHLIFESARKMLRPLFDSNIVFLGPRRSTGHQEYIKEIHTIRFIQHPPRGRVVTITTRKEYP